MQHTIKLFQKDRVIEKKVEHGLNLLSFLRENSILSNTPCGGNGTCGKCRVKVGGLAEEPSGKERKLLGEKAVENGYRLACYHMITSDLDIHMENAGEEAAIMTAGRDRDVVLDPVVRKRYVELEVPDIHNQLSDLERVMNAWNEVEEADGLDVLRSLPETLREKEFKLTLVRHGRKLSAVEAGDTTGGLYGIAVDIGTTTIAAYLYDLNTGRKVDVYSLLNPQRKYGADVLSRIGYTMKSEGALEDMHRVLIDSINMIISQFSRRNHIDKSSIYTCVFVGNTTMMHFLLNLSPKNIAVSPFIPVTTGLHTFKAGELGINIHTRGQAIALPSVSGYVGADVVAGILSSGMYEDSKVSLLVDIGTNGEMVLGNSEWLYACSTAAGPAFEGANIRNGVGGIKGAIDRVHFGDSLEMSTIGGGMAVGICGSGIVDAIAGMLARGVIDETGRLADADEAANLPPAYRTRMKDIDGIRSFLLLDSDQCAAGTDIAITQKDVRELQNAKAAIAAGIRTMIKHAGIELQNVEKVYLAGGFGNYIEVESALDIGLLPRELAGRIESIGNSAGTGAVQALLSGRLLHESEKIRQRVRYIELSASADFVDAYIENMLF